MKGSIGKFLFRVHPTKLNFFKGVKCDSVETKELVLSWMFKLQKTHNISVHKFSDLFEKYPSVIFPIQLLNRSTLYSFEIKDKLGNIYFFDYDTSYNGCYSIRSKDKHGDVNVDFKIVKGNHIVLKRINILLLDENGVCTKDDSFSIVYNCKNNTTIVTIKKVTQMKPYLKIVYPTQDKDFDGMVLSLLFNEEINLNNVFPLFVSIYEIRDLEDLSIKIMDNSSLLSNITLENGKVTQYSYTESISRTRVCLNQVTLLQDVHEFINEHSC